MTSKNNVYQFKYVQLFVVTSTAFDIKNLTSESLPGRKWEYIKCPIKWKELENTMGYIKILQQLDLQLVYGMYPEVITHPSGDKERLKLLIDSYLYKNLLVFSQIKKPYLLAKLLQALAFRIGS